ncbi:hypothetical protein [Rouxiella badensis]|uniref:hypothetical protein n=1 Tax=Rouxiella badensis TaxID=1646377 RepID=UPI00036078D0|nr:hypothetical protein [Rouxiella badensis]WAT10159.1 hypothetical protein O1V65_06235 [Rouxiella badensis]
MKKISLVLALSLFSSTVFADTDPMWGVCGGLFGAVFAAAANASHTGEPWTVESAEENLKGAGLSPKIYFNALNYYKTHQEEARDFSSSWGAHVNEFIHGCHDDPGKYLSMFK